MSNTSPTSLSEFTGHFENGAFSQSDGTQPFYYEPSTNTINFGYGINLTVRSFDDKDPVDSWLTANGIDLTDDQWTAIGNVTASNGAQLQQQLNAAVAGTSATQRYGAIAVAVVLTSVR